MDEKELLKTAKACQSLARMLGDRQSREFVYKRGIGGWLGFWFRKLFGGRLYPYILPPDATTRLVNALLDSGNRLEVIAKEGFTPKGDRK